MKKYIFKSLIIISLLLIMIFYNNMYINNIDNINKIICSNIESDIIDYKEVLINNKYNLIITRIKYRNIYNYKNELVIYKGFKNNIKVGDTILYDNILIGVVSKTYAYSSVVKLLTNSKSIISIKINNNYGTLKYNDRLYIDDIDGTININDFVYTSGLGNIIPNLLVGIVEEIDNNIIYIKPAIDYKSINYLYILGDSND